MKKTAILLATLILFSTPTKAHQIKEWDIIPSESSINFLVRQNNLDITGHFKNFSGKILFDESNLKKSKVTILIDLTSVSTSLKEASSELPKKEWLYTEKFPQAKFTSDKFTKISPNQFNVAGFLQMKEFKVPVSFDFTLNESSLKKAQAKGLVKLLRSSFDIGNKDEKLAHGVKDEVKVEINISALLKD